MPRGLDEEPLLRIHESRGVGRDTEEGRVEGQGIVDEPAPAALDIGVLTPVPPLLRNLAYAVRGLAEIPRERGQVGRARIAARDPDYRDV